MVRFSWGNMRSRKSISMLQRRFLDSLLFKTRWSPLLTTTQGGWEPHFTTLFELLWMVARFEAVTVCPKSVLCIRWCFQIPVLPKFVVGEPRRGCLWKMLELIMKLLNRLGHSLVLSPAGYVSNLYDTKTGKPLRFPNKSSALHVTEYEHVQVALDQLSEYDLKAIQLLWSQYNEQQLHRLLDRFSPFLLSPIVRRCYIIYETQSSDKYIRVLGNLCKYVHCNGVKALDELASVRLEHITEASLGAMFTQSLLSTSPTLRRLVHSIKIVIPHNMIVEAGFLKMKFSKGVFQPGTRADLYDSLRFVSDFFDRVLWEIHSVPNSSESDVCSKPSL